MTDFSVWYQWEASPVIIHHTTDDNLFVIIAHEIYENNEKTWNLKNIYILCYFKYYRTQIKYNQNAYINYTELDFHKTCL